MGKEIGEEIAFFKNHGQNFIRKYNCEKQGNQFGTKYGNKSRNKQRNKKRK